MRGPDAKAEYSYDASEGSIGLEELSKQEEESPEKKSLDSTSATNYTIKVFQSHHTSL